MANSHLHSIKASHYQQCTRCVMDTSASEISFDANGVCNFCTEFLERSSDVIYEDPRAKHKRLSKLVGIVRKSGRGKQYDCVVGVSGGVDSSRVLVEAKLLGLRPIAVHMDNGWNSDLAQSNIANLVNGLGVDLYTHVIDWEEYRGLMQCFFDADVIDIELLYDNAMASVCYQQARKLGIKYILSGCNQATEGMRMPRSWNWYKYDARNIKSLSIHFGPVRIKTFPLFSTFDYFLNEFALGIRWVSFLDYIHYNKAEALGLLERDYGYRRYPYKHYESIFTRFYQGYILPNKFGVDKRLLHLSTLIASGQMNRVDAIACLSKIPYPTTQDLDADLNYFLKKMGWSQDDLSLYIRRPEVRHDAYHSEAKRYEYLAKIVSPRIKSVINKLLKR